MVRQRGHVSNLAIARDVQTQTAHRHQLAFFADAQEWSQLLDARAQRSTWTCCYIDGAHLRNVSRSKLDHLSRNAVRRRRSEEHTSELQSRLHLVCRLP